MSVGSVAAHRTREAVERDADVLRQESRSGVTSVVHPVVPPGSPNRLLGLILEVLLDVRELLSERR